MHAIEFMAEVEDGAIKVPKQHLKGLSKEFRVIILVDEKIAKKPKKNI